MRIVVALGGNAIQHRSDRGTAQEERAAIREASDGLATLAAAGHQLVVTHGNGPQVGRLMILNGATQAVSGMPLDVLVAQTQGEIGALIQQELQAALRRVSIVRPVVSLVTLVLVDAADPAFMRPTKPVGPPLSDAQALELRAAQVAVGPAPGGGWRRLVPSPRPVAIVEEEAIQALVDADIVPVAAGGGGVPVVREGNSLRGVEAVVDKDLASALVVRSVSADALLILTDVEFVYARYGTPEQRAVRRMTVAEARAGLESDEFPPGSMGPKIEAAIDAVAAGARAIITSLDASVAALEGRTGTEIVA